MRITVSVATVYNDDLGMMDTQCKVTKISDVPLPIDVLAFRFLKANKIEIDKYRPPAENREKVKRFWEKAKKEDIAKSKWITRYVSANLKLVKRYARWHKMENA